MPPPPPPPPPPAPIKPSGGGAPPPPPPPPPQQVPAAGSGGGGPPPPPPPVVREESRVEDVDVDDLGDEVTKVESVDEVPDVVQVKEAKVSEKEDEVETENKEDDVEERNENEIVEKSKEDEEDEVMVKTEFVWADGAQNDVKLSGAWNGWMAIQMYHEGGGMWSVVTPVPVGVHQFKFIVDAEWKHSTRHPTMQSGPGEVNNVRVIRGPPKTNKAPPRNEPAVKQERKKGCCVLS